MFPPAIIKAVSLDAGNTLFHAKPSVGDIYARVSRKHGLDLPPSVIASRFSAVFHQMTDPELVSGNEETIYSKTWWFKLVQSVFGEAVRMFHDFNAFFDELYETFARGDSWELYEDVLPTLEYLKNEGIKRALISNWDFRLLGILEDLKLTSFFDCICVSAVEKVHKPAKEIFLRAVTRLDVAPEEMLHIGDDYRLDGLGAKNAGLQAVIIHRNDRTPPGGDASLPVIRVIRDLKEIWPEIARHSSKRDT